jgi:hypothetical protein
VIPIASIGPRRIRKLKMKYMKKSSPSGRKPISAGSAPVKPPTRSASVPHHVPLPVVASRTIQITVTTIPSSIRRRNQKRQNQTRLRLTTSSSRSC